jgi:GT2 family glycosyltransferase/SAM-dependent methyltransferase/glycosyltransferase involved in cell wall biosynthesis
LAEYFQRILPPAPLEWTGERLTTAIPGSQVEVEHLHRYFLARELCRGLDVLDVASGEGYGSALLAQTARSVVGLDISADAVAYAGRAYLAPNINFIAGDARAIPLRDASVDVVVSFETIEHFHEQEDFVREIRRVLRPDGVFIVSTPDRDTYSSSDSAPNAFHMRELNRAEFCELLQRTFDYVVMQGQRPFLGSALVSDSRGEISSPTLVFERHEPTQFEASIGLSRPVYLIAIASSAAIATAPNSLFVETSDVGEMFGGFQVRDELRRTVDELAKATDYARHVEDELQSRAEELHAAHSEHDATRAALADASSYARHLESELAATAKALMDAGAYARSIEQQVTLLSVQNQQAVATLNALLSSTTWKILQPVRTLVDKYGKVRRLLSVGSKHSDQSNEIVTSGTWQQSISTALAGSETHPVAKQADEKASVLLNAKSDLQEFLASDRKISFPGTEAPEISILLVLWNQAHWTLQCLRALHNEVIALNHPAVEVIVVDNASSDQTSALLRRVSGVRAIRNAENVGFVRAANQAAHSALGRHLLFLNNDAFVRPGALANALAALSSAADVGAVGGRLILPSGLVQEAGSIVWSDGSTLGYGRGARAEAGEVMFRRDVDYCSGALLMTPRTLWEKLGGFDEAYSPAYYEDADYCMRVRECGLRVLYEPSVVADHYEHGSETERGDAVNLMLINRQRFRTRFAEALQKNYLTASPANILFGRDHPGVTRRRLLVIDNEVPFEALGSGYPRMRHLLKEATKAGWSVSFFPLLRPTVDWPATWSELPREIEILSNRGASGLTEFLQERRGYYDAVLISRPDNMMTLRAILRKQPDLLGQAPLIYDAEALFAQRTVLQRAFEGRPCTPSEIDALINNEVSLVSDADAIICVTEAEAKEFRTRREVPVHVLSHPANPSMNAPGFAGREGFLFVGRLLEPDAPNWRGLAWFIREVWPLIRARLPKGTLKVAGHLHPSFNSLAAPGVHFIGPITELAHVYNMARVFVAPIIFAAGIPIKIVEAAASGLPVVGTHLMSRQLNWTPGVELMAEDEPSVMASGAVSLHENEAVWSAMRAAAWDRIREEFNTEDFALRLGAVLDSISHNQPATYSEPAARSR